MGAFDDLIPQSKAGADPFADLIPEVSGNEPPNARAVSLNPLPAIQSGLEEAGTFALRGLRNAFRGSHGGPTIPTPGFMLPMGGEGEIRMQTPEEAEPIQPGKPMYQPQTPDPNMFQRFASGMSTPGNVALIPTLGLENVGLKSVGALAKGAVGPVSRTAAGYFGLTGAEGAVEAAKEFKDPTISKQQAAEDVLGNVLVAAGGAKGALTRPKILLPETLAEAQRTATIRGEAGTSHFQSSEALPPEIVKEAEASRRQPLSSLPQEQTIQQVQARQPVIKPIEGGGYQVEQSGKILSKHGDLASAQAARERIINAQTIPGDQTQAPEGGLQPEGSKVVSGEDLQQPAPRPSDAPAPEEGEVLLSRADIIANAPEELRTFRQSAEQLALKLEGLKGALSPEKGYEGLQLFGVTGKIWDAGVSAAQAVIRAGGSIADAIEAAISHIKANFTGKWDERAAREHLATKLGEQPAEGTAPQAAQATASPAKAGEAPIPPKSSQGISGVQKAVTEVQKTAHAVGAAIVRGDIRSLMSSLRDKASNQPVLDGRESQNAVALKAGTKEFPEGDPKLLSGAIPIVTAGGWSPSDTGELVWNRDGKAWLRLGDLLKWTEEGVTAAQAEIDKGGVMNRWRGSKWLKAAQELKAEVEYARDNWENPQLREVAKKMRTELDNQLAKEIASGMDVKNKENYFPGRYNAEVWMNNSVIFGDRAGVFGKNFSGKKAFDKGGYYEAIANGPYIRATKDGAAIVGHRVRQGQARMGMKAWWNSLKEFTDPDSGLAVAVNSRFKPSVDSEGNPSGEWQSASPEYVSFDSGNGQRISVLKGFDSLAKALTQKSWVQESPIPRAALHYGQMIKN